MRSVRGRRRVWRAAKRAAEEARDENWVGETQRATEEVERQKGLEKKGERQQAEQRSHRAPYAAPAANHSNRISRHARGSRVPMSWSSAARALNKSAYVEIA